MLLAAVVPWHKLAEKDVGGMVDPSHLFAWPFCRVLAVYLLPLATGETETDLSDPRAAKAWLANRRAKRAAKRE